MKTQFSKIDLAALQGSWIQVDFQENGVSNPPDELGDTSRSITTFSEDRFSVRSPKGTLLLEGTFELDASCTPKAVDWIDSVWIPAWKAARLDIIAALSLR
jgi:uncharacterized protein (TIGR03067 family)